MTAVCCFSVAVEDTSDCDSPQEITEACKSSLLCQQGRLGDCSWTVRHPDTAEKRGKTNIVKGAHKSTPTRGQSKERSVFQTERKTKACATFNKPALTKVPKLCEMKGHHGIMVILKTVIIASHFHFRFKL